MRIFEIVTERVLKKLEAGVVPWRKTWKTGLPKSLSSGREYRGINLIVLAASEFESAYWLTYREAERLGGHVRKTEQGTPIVYWKWRTAEELRRLVEEKKMVRPARCVPFASTVFNLDQVERIDGPAEVTARPRERLRSAERILEGMIDAPEIVHAVMKNPCYRRVEDQVYLPHLSQFENGDEYYSTLFHELVHSTGHPSRLDRFSRVEGDPMETYSFEELVAELGASFLCAYAGIANPVTEELQASYVANWSRVFQQDRRILLRASSVAQKATDYIRGTVFNEATGEAA